MRRLRYAIGLASAVIVVGAAFSSAAPSDDHHAAVPAVDEDNESTPAQDESAAEAEEQSDENGGQAGERKENHGFFVSAAAQCEDVDDPATTETNDFVAPDDCDSSGRAHGEYVSSVAKSSAGKPEKAGGPKDDEGSEGSSS